DVLNVGDIQSITCALCAIHFNLQLRNASRSVNVGASHTAHTGDRLKNFLSLVLKHISFWPKDLDNDLPVDLRDAFQNIVPNWLRKRRLNAGQRIQLLPKMLDELFARKI